MTTSDIVKISEFLNDFSKQVKKLTTQFNYKDGGEILPWLIYDGYEYNPYTGFFMEDVIRFELQVEDLEKKLSVLPDFNSNFEPLIKKIKATSEKYSHFYRETAEKDLFKFSEEKKAKDSFIRINLKQFLNENQYTRLYHACTNTLELINEYRRNPEMPTGFNDEIDSGLIFKAYPQLIAKKYIQGDETSFLAIFNPIPLPDTFTPIKWIKTTTKNKYVNKKSLIDMLKIAGVKDLDLKKINSLFANSKGDSINLKSANLYPNKGKEISEFHNELLTIFS